MQFPFQDCGGMMTAADVFCRVNRARGLELLSPEDLLNGCRAMAEAGVPARIHTFDSGVVVLQLASHSEEALARRTRDALDAAEDTGLTAEELSRAVGVSVVLARERLLAAERRGLACRDDSVEGLRFYTNKFLVAA